MHGYAAPKQKQTLTYILEKYKGFHWSILHVSIF